MIPQSNKRIKLHPVPSLEADAAEYRVIVDDMIRNAGALTPCPNWLMTDNVSQLAESYDLKSAYAFAQSDAAFAKVSEYMNLMSAWVGGSQPPSSIETQKYREFLQSRDVLKLWSENMDGLGRQDLGSLMDLNLLYAFSAAPKDRPTRILEVGGGYGRLAEAAWNIFGRSIQYMMIDSVPASLYYAKKYLERACPDARVASCYGDASSDEWDIAIVPAWYFFDDQGYDICINIESMQEMNQFHVDHFLRLFDSVAVDGATIYISNAHEYYFRGNWNYPAHWRKLFHSNTPRSNLCGNHPTEIFRKECK